MGLLPDTQTCGLRMRRECRERFPRHWLQRKPLVSGPGMHHGTCVTHVPWCMLGSLTCSGGENVPGIPGACTTSNFAYLVRDPLLISHCNIIPPLCNYFQTAYKLLPICVKSLLDVSFIIAWSGLCGHSLVHIIFLTSEGQNNSYKYF